MSRGRGSENYQNCLKFVAIARPQRQVGISVLLPILLNTRLWLGWARSHCRQQSIRESYQNPYRRLNVRHQYRSHRGRSVHQGSLSAVGDPAGDRDSAAVR